MPAFEPHAPPGGAVVGDLRVLVHRGADPVADVLAHHREPGRLGDLPSTAAPMSPSVLAGDAPASIAASSEPRVTSMQPPRLVVDLADRDRDRGVGVPALDDRPAVDRDDVAVLEHDGVAGDAVHDHLVR